jgi:hypothetical protein
MPDDDQDRPPDRDGGSWASATAGANNAASISRPDTPKMSETTEESLIWASSRSFSTRFFSAVRTLTSPAL